MKYLKTILTLTTLLILIVPTIQALSQTFTEPFSDTDDIYWYNGQIYSGWFNRTKDTIINMQNDWSDFSEGNWGPCGGHSDSQYDSHTNKTMWGNRNFTGAMYLRVKTESSKSGGAYCGESGNPTGYVRIGVSDGTTNTAYTQLEVGGNTDYTYLYNVSYNTNENIFWFNSTSKKFSITTSSLNKSKPWYFISYHSCDDNSVSCDSCHCYAYHNLDWYVFNDTYYNPANNTVQSNEFALTEEIHKVNVSVNGNFPAGSNASINVSYNGGTNWITIPYNLFNTWVDWPYATKTNREYILWLEGAKNLDVAVTSLSLEEYYIHNISIQLKINGSSTYLQTFNVTINGTQLIQTTTGNATLPFTTDQGAPLNFTLAANGFQTRNITNNITYDQYITFNVDQKEMEGIAFSMQGTNFTNTTKTWTCTYTNPTPYSTTEYLHVQNLNDSKTWKSTGNYILNLTDFADALKFTCEICTTYKCTNSSDVNYANNIIDTALTFLITDYQNAWVNQTNFTISQYGINHLQENNISYNLSKFLNSTNKTITTLVEIYDYINYNNADYIHNTTFTETNTTMEFRMLPNELKIQFPEYVSGVIADTQKSRWFNESLLLVVQSGLEIGQVNLMFYGTEGNYSQFYEYINDQQTYISEEMYLLDQKDTLAYFKIQDLAAAPVQDALIRMYQYKPNSTDYETRELIGQRLSDSNGQTLFVLDSETQVVFTITKDGYGITTKVLNVIELDTSYTEPFLITISPDASNSVGYDSTYVPPTIQNTSKSITVRAYSPTALSMSVNTDYGEAHGQADTAMSEGELNVFTATLQPGIHYAEGQESDITVIFTKDSSFLVNRTIAWQELLERDNFLNIEKANIPEALYNAYIVVIFLIVVMASSFTGIRMKSNTAGATALLILSIIASLLDPKFLWLVLIGIIGVVGSILYKNQQS